MIVRATYVHAALEPPVPDRRGPVHWRRWCAGVLAATGATLAAVGAINAAVDPFQQYRVASSHAPRFYPLHHRWINPGIAKHAPYQTALIGSSIMAR